MNKIDVILSNYFEESSIERRIARQQMKAPAAPASAGPSLANPGAPAKPLASAPNAAAAALGAGPQMPEIPKAAPKAAPEAQGSFAEEVPAPSVEPDRMASGKGHFRTSGQPFVNYDDIPAGAAGQAGPNSSGPGLAKLLGGLGAGGLGAAGLYAMLNGEDPDMLTQAQQAVA